MLAFAFERRKVAKHDFARRLHLQQIPFYTLLEKQSHTSSELQTFKIKTTHFNNRRTSLAPAAAFLTLPISIQLGRV